MTDAATVAPGVLRVLAPNASALTGAGTNSYVLRGEAGVVIDPGPDDDAHLAAILAALGGRPAALILLTHGHADHAALTPRLAAAIGATVLSGRDGTLAGAVHAPPWRLRALPTPGHAPDHVVLDAEGAGLLFTGDHVLGDTSTMVAPPEGDMGAYLASLEALGRLGPRRLLPGHGPAVEDGQARIAALLAHRRGREAQVLAALAEAPATPAAVAARLYPGLAQGLAEAARLTILAHLMELERRGLVARASADRWGAVGTG